MAARDGIAPLGPGGQPRTPSAIHGGYLRPNYAKELLKLLNTVLTAVATPLTLVMTVSEISAMTNAYSTRSWPCSFFCQILEIDILLQK